ncbi:putative Zn-dependent protease DUF2268 [Mucilaginibacter gracilis]|uniref:Putative Zn-dependent protease DUF2268 n=1 Tax=Mucilaginibacter gracilis TaxID=423350 RepID=A0A495J1D3_9SPHI|nr:DUF2268 domain-containing putative Zn-dependent protease [Mucilaginibacter gracilis]RKR82124.1 putative Zn-dependent protease DUF2268 [Mucilaginibacter gracilis]
MKKITLIVFLHILTARAAIAQKQEIRLFTSDITNFWNAYDHITVTKDSARQYAYMDSLFLKKATPGLKALMQVREYTAKSYIDAINNYPMFWRSVRPNTLKADGFAKVIDQGIARFKKLYPELKPAKIYFTIGALRTGGTTLDSLVLIGAEVALGDKQTVTTEFPRSLSHLRTYFDSEPMKSMAFNNIHEYVHTQQKTTVANTLLGQSVLEGVAEFLAVQVSGQASPTPAVAYGKRNDVRIRQAFAAQLFNPFTGFWLYSNQENEFHVRDLGYYVGYAICEKYYEKAADKKQAIREMIRLDYNDEAALSRFVEQSGYFDESMQSIKKRFETSRPAVVAIGPFSNGSSQVAPSTTKLTVTFSEAMDEKSRNFDLGPLGEDNLMRVKKILGYAEDGRSLSFEVELKPDRHYQLLLGEGFRNKAGLSMRPYLIDFKTAAR